MLENLLKTDKKHGVETLTLHASKSCGDNNKKL